MLALALVVIMFFFLTQFAYPTVVGTVAGQRIPRCRTVMFPYEECDWGYVRTVMFLRVECKTHTANNNVTTLRHVSHAL